jgi:hypothetical protein
MSETKRLFLVNSDNKHAMSAVKKIASENRPGAFVQLTAAEYDAFLEGVTPFEWLVDSEKTKDCG